MDDLTAPQEWWPVPGAVATEQGEGYATSYPALYECPTCAAAVPRGSLEKHAGWHTLNGGSGA